LVLMPWVAYCIAVPVQKVAQENTAGAYSLVLYVSIIFLFWVVLFGFYALGSLLYCCASTEGCPREHCWCLFIGSICFHRLLFWGCVVLVLMPWVAYCIAVPVQKGAQEDTPNAYSLVLVLFINYYHVSCLVFIC
jgi:hypothetical protein